MGVYIGHFHRAGLGLVLGLGLGLGLRRGTEVAYNYTNRDVHMVRVVPRVRVRHRCCALSLSTSCSLFSLSNSCSIWWMLCLRSVW